MRIAFPFRQCLAGVVAVLLAACHEPAATYADPGAEVPVAAIPVTITTSSGTHEYRAELALTPEEQARGLMFRQELAPDAGMLFINDPPRPAGFWMKNTYIPLDMIFIAPDGTIDSIAANTIPLTTDTYTSRGTVKAVLELNGGEAARIGAKAGDRVDYTPPG